MIKDIIEKYNEIETFEGYIEIEKRLLLSCLEKSAIQEEALIKALIKDISLICQNCQEKDYRRCWKEKGFCKTYDERIQLLETHTGKKWDEIKEVYR